MTAKKYLLLLPLLYFALMMLDIVMSIFVDFHLLISEIGISIDWTSLCNA